MFWDTETRKAVHAYIAARSDDYLALFIRLDNCRGQPGPDGEHWRMTPQSVWDIVKRYAAAFGIHATPHAFRHAMASAMLENDAPISLTQELLGRSSPTVTRQVYAAYEQRTVRAGFHKYNPPTSEQVAKLEAEQERRRTQGGQVRTASGRGGDTVPHPSGSGGTCRSGRPVDVMFCQVSTVRDGKILAARLYYDAMAFANQLGLLPQNTAAGSGAG